MRIACLLCLLLIITTCQAQNTKETAMDEIRVAEEKFCTKAQEVGLKQAFLEFADPNASIVRNNKVFKGKEGISQYFEQGDFSNVRLKWKPEFIDVSESGDLGYTFGT